MINVEIFQIPSNFFASYSFIFILVKTTFEITFLYQPSSSPLFNHKINHKSVTIDFHFFIDQISSYHIRSNLSSKIVDSDKLSHFKSSDSQANSWRHEFQYYIDIHLNLISKQFHLLQDKLQL